MLSVFNSNKKLVLAHKSVREDKTNEIPKFRELLKELGVKGCIITVDAMHCQKKLKADKEAREHRNDPGKE